MQREKWRVKFVEFIYRCREIFHHKAVDNSSIVYYRRDIAKKKRDILPIDSWKLAIVAATTVTTSFSINICHNKLFLSDRSVENKKILDFVSSLFKHIAFAMGFRLLCVCMVVEVLSSYDVSTT